MQQCLFMATIKKFEDLESWQLARIFIKEIFVMANAEPLSTDYELKAQLKKAALSISNNIAEGFGRFSNKDFIRFLDYSSGSCSETKNMLYLMLDLGYVSEQRFNQLMLEVEGIQKKVLALIKYLVNKQK